MVTTKEYGIAKLQGLISDIKEDYLDEEEIEELIDMITEFIRFDVKVKENKYDSVK